MNQYQNVESVPDKWDFAGKMICPLRARLVQESGVEVVEYVGLAGIVIALIGAVVLYVSSDAGRAITNAIRDIIQATIGGMQRGW